MTATTKTTAPVALPRLALTGIDADVRTVLTSSNPALVRAREAIPAFRERAQALADVLVLEEKLNAQPTRTTEQVVEDLISRLGKGEPVDATDVEAAARELSSGEAISTTRRALIEHVKLEASASLSLVISGHYDALRGDLHRTLTNVVDEVRANQLHEVRDAAAAISSRRVPDHQRFNELAAEYGVVRAAQFIVDKADLGPHATGGASSPTSTSRGPSVVPPRPGPATAGGPSTDCPRPPKRIFEGTPPRTCPRGPTSPDRRPRSSPGSEPPARRLGCPQDASSRTRCGSSPALAAQRSSKTLAGRRRTRPPPKHAQRSTASNSSKKGPRMGHAHLAD